MPDLPPDLSEFAPAKLNLYLHVLGRDARNYHLLDSLVTFADAGDVLHAQPATGFSLAIDGPCGAGLEADERNLVWCAAVGLGDLAGRTPDYAVRLTKHLPVASGIGGGSSDAAAMLRLLCREWGLDPLSPEVMALARQLGADVPMCVPARTTYAGGVGELLEPCPLPLPAAPLVLINPGVAVSTQAVFARRQGAFTNLERLKVSPRNTEELADLLRPMRNDLTAPAIALAPVIGTVLQTFAASPDCLLARMLGSGATCYGLFTTQATAHTFAEQTRRAYPNWWVHAGHLVNSLDELKPAAPNTA